VIGLGHDLDEGAMKMPTFDEDLVVNGRVIAGAAPSGSVTFLPGDGWAWFHIDNGPTSDRPIGRLRFSHGVNPGDEELLVVTQDGNVGIGTSTPQARLEVNGDIIATGDIILRNEDFAEDFDFAEMIDAGTVVALNGEGKLEPSSQPYDTRVVGVVSGAGHLRPGLILGRQPTRGNRLPIALVGKVCCRVDAEPSPIAVGDLLTTAILPGCAMKVQDGARAFGAVIGKALAPLGAGQGLIPILVALQ
jgi:hypothetical protein